MNKYVIQYYNHCGCQDQFFHVIAKDEEDAERIFSILEPRHYKKNSGIDGILDYDEEQEFYSQLDVIEKSLGKALDK